MRRRVLIVAAVVAVAVVAGLATGPGSSRVGRPTFVVVDTEPAPGQPIDPRCPENRVSAGTNEWSLVGEMRGMSGDLQGSGLGGGRGVILWRTEHWHAVDVPQTITGEMLGERGQFELLALGDRSFGLRLEPLEPSGAHLCGLSLTIPTENGSASFWWHFTAAVGWRDLSPGERHTTTTNWGERFTLSRETAKRWRLEVNEEGRPRSSGYLKSATVVITFDRANPPWNGAEIDIHVDGVAFAARGHLDVSPIEASG